MAFIRRKRQANGQTVYQVVRSCRDGGKVRQQVLVSLSHSPTITAAIERAEQNRAEAARYGVARWARYWSAKRERLAEVQQETGLL